LVVAHLPGMHLTQKPALLPRFQACPGLPLRAPYFLVLAATETPTRRAMFLPSLAAFAPHSPLAQRNRAVGPPLVLQWCASKVVGIPVSLIWQQWGHIKMVTFSPAFPICLGIVPTRQCVDWCRISRRGGAPASIGRRGVASVSGRTRRAHAPLKCSISKQAFCLLPGDDHARATPRMPRPTRTRGPVGLWNFWPNKR
jgi:hypothetical protein